MLYSENLQSPLFRVHLADRLVVVTDNRLDALLICPTMVKTRSCLPSSEFGSVSLESFTKADRFRATDRIEKKVGRKGIRFRLVAGK